MTTLLEKQTRQAEEVLSQAELGKHSHEAITGMVNNLLATPEFMVALGKTFFGRSFANGGRALIADGVAFDKGGFMYVVSYHAEPLRFSPKEVRDYNVRINLTIDKHVRRETPGKFNQKFDRVNSLGLGTYFVEDQDGQIKRFKDGSAGIQGEFQVVPPHVVPEATVEYHDEMAIEKMPQYFGDLYPSATL